MRTRYKKWAPKFLEDNKLFISIENEQSFCIDNFKQKFLHPKNDFVVEIGCGKGKFIIENAIKNKKVNFLAIEKVYSVVALAVKKATLSLEKLNNLQFIHLDVVEMKDLFPNEFFTKIYINFPDPWFKAKHAKRRLIEKFFLQIYYFLLKEDGVIEFRTDQIDLYKYALQEINKSNFFDVIESSIDFHTTHNVEITTEYEDKFLQSNQKIYFLKLLKKSTKNH